MQDFSKFKGRIVPFRGMDDDGMITLYIRYSHQSPSGRLEWGVDIRGSPRIQMLQSQADGHEECH